jgi:selenocysteine-specific elongation factor
LTGTSELTTRSQIVICLAGHIDHGKSSLVRALTGGAVDRLPEEKRRGMTIDLGFAHFDCQGIRFALTDVPGHESFIHTMVAGASGVDAALLVIAADDSVMPQTREHLAVLELLGIRNGVIAITKCDLADDEQLELVQLEIAHLVEATCLAQAPVIKVSTENGLGVEEVRQALVELARGSCPRPSTGQLFRMPIDRAFSPAGQGAVVTGTIWRGTVRVGDTLLVLPNAMPVRIRRLQSQGVDVESVAAGQRAAVNLAGVKSSEIRRGDELVTPQAFEPSRRMLVRVQALPDAPRHALRHRQSVRVHLGANQATGQLLLGQDRHDVQPGEEVFAILRCAKPIVADYAQPFILRQLSPERTIGGGSVIAPVLRPSDRLNRCLAIAPALSSEQPQVRLAGYIDLRREACFDDATQSRIGLDRGQFEAAAQQLVEQRAAHRTAAPQPRYITSERFQKLKQQMVRCCDAELARRKPSRLVPLSVVLSAMNQHASPGVLDAVLMDLTARSELVRRGDRVGLPNSAKLSHRQRQLLDVLLKECTEAGAMPPTLKEFAVRNSCTLKDLEPLVQVAVDEGRLVRLSPDLAIASEALESLRQDLAGYFRLHPAVKIGEVRERWGMTRKHAVPIFEFFDRQQVTARSGDLHTAGPRIAVPVDEPAL